MTTQRFGSVSLPPSTPSAGVSEGRPDGGRRPARLRALYRILRAPEHPQDERPEAPPARRRAAARAMRVPANPIVLEPASSIAPTEIDLRAVPDPEAAAPRPPRALGGALVIGLAIVLAAVILASASFVHDLLHPAMQATPQATLAGP